MRICMIVRAAYRDAANTKISEWSGNPADANTFHVPLFNAQGTIVAYWCDWNMSATRHDVAQFVQYLLANSQLDATDLTIREGLVSIGTKKALIFDADRVSPAAVLAHLGLKLDAA
jgi:hypothetical protein